MSPSVSEQMTCSLILRLGISLFGFDAPSRRGAHDCLLTSPRLQGEAQKSVYTSILPDEFRLGGAGLIISDCLAQPCAAHGEGDQTPKPRRANRAARRCASSPKRPQG